MARLLFTFVALALVAYICAEPAGYRAVVKGAPAAGYGIGVGPGLGAKGGYGGSGLGVAAGGAAGGAAISAPVPDFAGLKNVAYKAGYGR